MALWPVSCDGARVGAPKQQEGSFSNDVAHYEEKIYVPDESESYVRITLRELFHHNIVIKLEPPLSSLK